MTNFRLRLLGAGLLGISLYALDQITKAWAENILQPQVQIPVLPGFFNLTYVRNTGIAFGMLEGNNVLLIVLASLMIILGIWMARQFNFHRWTTLAITALLLAGTLGNLTDRCRLGYVVDFLDFDLVIYRWPSFNIADSCITVAVVWILILTLRSERAATRNDSGSGHSPGIG